MIIVNEIEIQFNQVIAIKDKKLKQIVIDGLEVSDTPGINPYSRFWNPIKYPLFEVGIYYGRYLMLKSKKKKPSNWKLIIQNKIKELSNVS